MSYDGGQFSGKLVVITGGTSGIGLALAEEFGRLGGRVVVVADRSETVSAAVEHLRTSAEADGYVCDIGDSDAVTGTAALIVGNHGVPDILINNAGFAIYRSFEQAPAAEIERLMEVNFCGAIRVTKAFLSGMVDRRSGQIVNIASIAGAMPLTPPAVYSAAKHGMTAWSICLAAELDRFGIGVTVLCPGRVETNFFNHETFRKRLHRKETEMTVPMQKVVHATVDAIVRRQSIRFVPRYLGLFAWIYNALGPLVRGPYNRLLRSRIEDLYRTSSTQ